MSYNKSCLLQNSEYGKKQRPPKKKKKKTQENSHEQIW